MTEQMTEAGAFVLCTAIALFWIVVGLIVRVHAQRRSGGGSGSTATGLAQ
jgi:hypothetical protein